MWRLRFVDFLVKMWRLNAFWWVILPVPVTLKRFLALELVLTFGIIIHFSILPLRRFCTGRKLVGPLQEMTCQRLHLRVDGARRVVLALRAVLKEIVPTGGLGARAHLDARDIAQA